MIPEAADRHNPDPWEVRPLLKGCRSRPHQVWIWHLKEGQLLNRDVVWTFRSTGVFINAPIYLFFLFHLQLLFLKSQGLHVEALNHSTLQFISLIKSQFHVKHFSGCVSTCPACLLNQLLFSWMPFFQKDSLCVRGVYVCCEHKKSIQVRNDSKKRNQV